MTAALAAIATALVFAAVVILVGGDDNAPIQVVLPTTPANEAIQGTDSAGTKNPSSEDLRVYVSGAVLSRGVYRLQPGQRLADALSAAGGATSDANLDAVNLALRVQDEAQYHIPRVGETPPPVAALAAG